MPFDGQLPLPLPLEVVYNIDHFETWLRRQPSHATFCYMSTGGCCLHQYFKAQGMPVEAVGGSEWDDFEGQTHTLPPILRYSVVFAVPFGSTYGAVLDQLQLYREGKALWQHRV